MGTLHYSYLLHVIIVLQLMVINWKLKFEIWNLNSRVWMKERYRHIFLSHSGLSNYPHSFNPVSFSLIITHAAIDHLNCSFVVQIRESALGFVVLCFLYLLWISVCAFPFVFNFGLLMIDNGETKKIMKLGAKMANSKDCGLM